MAQALKHAPLRTTRAGWRPRVRLRTAVACLVVLGVAASGWHYWTLYSSLSAAQSEMTAIHAELYAGGLDVNLPAERLEAVHARSERAGGAVARARLHYRWDPLVQVGRHVPIFGDQVNATGQLIDMAGLALQISATAAEAGGEFATIRDQRSPDEPLAGTLQRAIQQTQPRMDEVERLTQQLVAERLALGDRPLLPPLASARDQIDARLPGLATATVQLGQAYKVLPGLLGFEGERRYLVLALNNGELLPGGGLVSAAGVLHVSNGAPGEVEFVDSTTWKRDWEAQGGAYIEPPGPLKRYLLRDYTWNLLVSNWSPDFATWSRQALEFYQLVHGDQDVDGVVAMDLEVLRSLLAVTGPRTLDVEGHGAVTFTADNAILELERVTRHSFDPAEPDRKSVIGTLAEVLLTDIEQVPAANWGSFAEVIKALGAGRHIQVFSFHGPEQAFLSDLGWTGEIDATAPDYVQFNEASLNSTKLNLIIQPEGTYTVDISRLGTASHRLSLRYENPLPAWRVGKDATLVKQLMLGGLYGGYLRVFGPASMTGFTVTADGSPASIEDTESEGARRWFGTFMPLPAGASADRGFGWSVPMATTSPEAMEYEMLIQKQAGTRALCLDLVVSREGKPPAQLDIQGGHTDAQGRVCISTDVRIRAAWN